MGQPESLKTRREFQRVLRNGRAERRDGITVFVGAGAPGREPRVGIAVRMPGSAVRRNRVKRRLRSALAECEPLLGDAVIRADGGTADLEYQELVDHLKAALAAAGTGA